jgi:hypothetical protein
MRTGLICLNEMNRFFILLIAVLWISCTSNQPKDNRLWFNVKIKPEQKYLVTTTNSFKTEVRYEAKEKALNKLRSMGVKNPNILSRVSQSEMVLKTEKLLDDYIPVKLEITKSSRDNGQADVTQGLVICGESKHGNIPEFTSIASDKPASIDEKVFLPAIQSNFSRLALPEKRLKIGDEFTVESSLTIPMEKSHVEIAVSTVYKLVSVVNELANFDITQNYAMNQLRMDNSFNGTGGGTGKLTYNADNNMVTSFRMKSKLEINKKLENFLFVLKTSNEFAQKIEVSKK